MMSLLRTHLLSTPPVVPYLPCANLYSTKPQTRRYALWNEIRSTQHGPLENCQTAALVQTRSHQALRVHLHSYAAACFVCSRVLSCFDLLFCFIVGFMLSLLSCFFWWMLFRAVYHDYLMDSLSSCSSAGLGVGLAQSHLLFHCSYLRIEA